MKKTATEINNNYKLQKRLDHFKKVQQEKVKKQQSKLIQMREQALQKSRDDIIMDYSKKEARYLSKQQKVLQRQERKLFGKKPLKSLEKKVSRAKEFDDLLGYIQKFAKLRDSDCNGMGKCITCGKLIHWKEGNGGHAISRGQRRSAYLEECINLQCIYCNQHLHGNYGEYRIALDKKYGEGTYERLKNMKGNLDVSIDRIKQQQLIYKEKIQQLLHTKK